MARHRRLGGAAAAVAALLGLGPPPPPLEEGKSPPEYARVRPLAAVGLLCLAPMVPLPF